MLTDDLLLAMGVPTAKADDDEITCAGELKDPWLEHAEFHDPTTYESRWDIPGRGFG
jgi:hypothetical protein